MTAHPTPADLARWQEDAQAAVDILRGAKRNMSDEAVLKFAERYLAVLRARVTELEQDKDSAYAERDQLVSALSKLLPAHLKRHPDDETWDDDWRWIVCIHGPAGQMTWYIHDSEREWFSHLDVDQECAWDGHSTDEKYRRLLQLDGARAARAARLKEVDEALARNTSRGPHWPGCETTGTHWRCTAGFLRAEAARREGGT